MSSIIDVSNGCLKLKSGASDCVLDSFVLPRLPFLIDQEGCVLIVSVVCIHFVVYRRVVDLCQPEQSLTVHLFDRRVDVHRYGLLIMMTGADIFMLRDMVVVLELQVQLI